jgi:hypothetical protein
MESGATGVLHAPQSNADVTQQPLTNTDQCFMGELRNRVFVQAHAMNESRANVDKSRPAVVRGLLCGFRLTLILACAS